jgi:hypothetical protein
MYSVGPDKHQRQPPNYKKDGNIQVVKSREARSRCSKKRQATLKLLGALAPVL